MLMLVHVGGVYFDALQAVLMRCSAMLTQWPCTQKTSMVYKAILSLLFHPFQYLLQVFYGGIAFNPVCSHRNERNITFDIPVRRYSSI